jgi:hypothetical protein
MAISNDFTVEGCGELVVSLQGGNTAQSIFGAVASTASDGYVASYTYKPEQNDSPVATCFTFANDDGGYFCIGVNQESGVLIGHGAGYWAFSEDELERQEQLQTTTASLQE